MTEDARARGRLFQADGFGAGQVCHVGGDGFGAGGLGVGNAAQGGGGGLGVAVGFQKQPGQQEADVCRVRGACCAGGGVHLVEA